MQKLFQRFKHNALAAIFLYFAAAAATGQDALSPLDDRRVADAGFRKIESRHLTLVTDLPSSEAVDALPGLFDEAHDQWLDYFQIKPRSTSKFRAFLMRNRERFVQQGLLPRDVPDFSNGYARGAEFWVMEQKSDYYRRHLLFHEGVHAFMNVHFGGCGPTWHAEGLAELLATHKLTEGKVEAPWFPRDRKLVPDWGRTKLVRDSVVAGQKYSADEMLQIEPRIGPRENELYGWCWAFAAFLKGHPRYRERFLELPARIQAPGFNGGVRRLFSDDWRELDEEWRLFASRIDYGYDLEREAIDFKPGGPLPPAGAKATIRADRGWQSSGLQLDAGRRYRVQAKGQFQIANTTKPWISEPSGVSIRYIEGRPLGVLLGAVRPLEATPEKPSPFLAPTTLGADRELTPDVDCVLYLRVNDAASELSDNDGTLSVQVTQAN